MNLVLDNEYQQTLEALKERVRSAQLKAARAVNTELIQLYWDIGNTILEKQKNAKWGSKFLEQTSKDLSSAFPGMQGFSRRNVAYMRKFSAEYPSFEFVQQGVAQLGWSAITILLDKVQDPLVRDWYTQEMIKDGWGRDTLRRMIQGGLYERQKTKPKITNFGGKLPKLQSELAHQMIKDPYCFDFMNIAKTSHERVIEQALIDNIKDFLRELGKGYAYVGNQYHLEVGGEDFYIDLLFFNIPMNCYIVIELKKGKFKPEYTGKLNFYLSVVDDMLKLDHHNPTVGMLLCETKNEVIAQYAVDGMTKPMGISEFELSKMLTQKLKGLDSPPKELEERTEQA